MMQANSPLMQANYTLSIEEMLELEQLSNSKPLLQYSLIREQEALKAMATALESDNKDEALRWAGYRKAIEDFHIGLREIVLVLKEKRKDQQSREQQPPTA